jgi:hypothetical protein
MQSEGKVPDHPHAFPGEQPAAKSKKAGERPILARRQNNFGYFCFWDKETWRHVRFMSASRVMKASRLVFAFRTSVR